MNSISNKPLVILTGPTAAGKTSISIELAKLINGEIISADSIQVYKGMDIGSAKVSAIEMDNIKHHLIDILRPDEEFNVTIFKQLAKEAIEEIYQKNKIPIIVGGTGFYIQALLYDIDFKENIDDGYRSYLEDLLESKGADYLYDLLKEIDEESTHTIHKNNTKRVIRALEYHHQTGGQISAHNKDQRQNESPYNFIYFVLNNDREYLYEQINKRVDIMIENGLVNEVKSLVEKYDLSAQNLSMQGIGYKEILDYINGKTSLDEAIDILKRDTRHFAKRQLTWFRREKCVTWIDKLLYENDKAILTEMINLLSKQNIIPPESS